MSHGSSLHYEVAELVDKIKASRDARGNRTQDVTAALVFEQDRITFVVHGVTGAYRVTVEPIVPERQDGGRGRGAAGSAS